MKLQTFLDAKGLFFEFTAATTVTFTDESRRVRAVEVKGHLKQFDTQLALQYEEVAYPIVVTHAVECKPKDGDIVVTSDDLREIVLWVSGCLERASTSVSEGSNIRYVGKDGAMYQLPADLDCTGFVENFSYEKHLKMLAHGK